ncbi:MAG: discoidin domain-containing protein [Phycisphaerales bacterium]|nr:discoidin domain-containing protein [Phycisphaerales bacterium]
MKFRLGTTIFAIFALAAAGAAQPVVLDACESADGWSVTSADGVDAAIALVDGAAAGDGLAGKAVRLNYDFKAGAGYCVLKKTVDLALPEDYRFAFQLRGDGPPNNLEFKLVDPAGENVWWVNQREYEFPREWRRVTLPARRFQFAWGPSGGKPLGRVGAIEIAVAAGGGGKGHIDIDQITFEPIPPRGEPGPVHVAFSSSLRPMDGPVTLPETGLLGWKSRPEDARPTVDIDLGGVREFGGLVVMWDFADFPVDYDVEASLDGRAYEVVAAVRNGRSGRRYVQISDGEAAHLRIRPTVTSRGKGMGIQRLEIAPVEFGQSRNAMFARVARDAQRGVYPRYFLNEQQPWTVVGVRGDDREALVDAAGAIELDRGGPRLEPFIFLNGRLYSWATAKVEQDLVAPGVPMPRVKWTVGDLTLTITAFADGTPGRSRLIAAYIVQNRGRPVDAKFLLALRPFQVLPPWHELNLTGGFSKVESILREGPRVLADSYCIMPWTRPDGFGATTLAAGEIGEFVSSGRVPSDDAVFDAAGGASAALLFNLKLDREGTRSIFVTSPFHEQSQEEPWDFGEVEAIQEFARRATDASREWNREVSRVGLRLPPMAKAIEETFLTMQASILVNADGPRIQPGSRTYERSWIRDGALTGTALLATGHAAEMGAFLDWYAGHQYPTGKIPCVVDRRGPDPVPENDSHGQYIYAVGRYFAFTRDRAFLDRHFPHVSKAVEYIESLRAQRMTEEFRDGPPEKRVLFGLVPESISHEGYSAKPMHSYWDGFFTIRGLADAAVLARAAEKPELAGRWQALADDYRKCMYDSMRLAMEQHKIEYIPGCAELGDFDATSTAIGVFPCGELGKIPQPQLDQTFNRYLEFFRKRRDGGAEWREFTPYEVRLVGTFVHLGRTEEAHELLDWFMTYQRPVGWRQWGEVAYRDENAAKFVGDMPHTWVGSDFINSVRSMLVYERDDCLVLCAGVPETWLEGSPGVEVRGFPTPFGELSYSLTWSGDEIVFQLAPSNRARPGRFEFVIPGRRAVGPSTDERLSKVPPNRHVTILADDARELRVPLEGR